LIVLAAKGLAGFGLAREEMEGMASFGTASAMRQRTDFLGDWLMVSVEN